MNFLNRLTGAGRTMVILLVVAVVGALLYFSGATEKLASSKLFENDGPSSSVSTTDKGDYDATLAVNTYCGFEPIVWANGGLKGSNDSYLYKKYGIKLNILIMDDFEAARAGLKDGSIDIEYCTLDALPTEMSSSGTMSDMKYFMLLNFSNGADALVADGSINNIGDLKGKKVAYAEGTASHTLLLNTLETNGMTMNDIIPVKVGSGIEAAQAFKSKAVAAACVWAPDDADCVAFVKNSKVLTSTAVANSLVSDGLIAKKEWLENNKELAAKIVEGILWANSEIKYNKDAFNEGAEVFAKAFETDKEFALASASKINYATLDDEKNWFGMNSDYSGMTGERIYTKMSRTYTDIGLAKSVMPWMKIVYPDILEMVISNNKLSNNQGATAAKKFSAPTENMKTEAALSTKKVTINFPTAGYTLDNNAQTIIDREFVDIAMQFGNARIRVEGNTDDTGNYDSNVKLSQARAQSVVNYLINEYKMNKNRFIVVGNGPKHARANGVTGADEAYRTTEFQLLND